MSSPIDTVLESARHHVDEVVKPSINSWNSDRAWPRKASDAAASMGLLGLYCPSELGGRSLALADGVRVYEELGKGDGAYAFALSMHNICAYAICNFATDNFKNTWARELTAGRKLANFALTEPQSGSDPVTMYTQATIDGSGAYTVSGTKAWVSLATEADVYLVVTKTSLDAGHKDMAMIAVPADSTGLSFGPLYDTASYNFLPMAEMYLDNVKVPAENVILPPGMGLKGALTAIDIARVSIASGCCGLMETALDTALRYAKGRHMYGTVNLHLDGIQWMLGNVATDLRISRLLYREAANALGTEDGQVLAAQAKLFVPDAALRAATTCTQVLGGMGLLNDYGLTRLTALAQMLKIVDGSTEVQRKVIGRDLEKRAASLPDIKIPRGYGES